jgi:flagellar biosynthesis/type III secretory pathway M-ring protein FliF/YscJ
MRSLIVVDGERPCFGNHCHSLNYDDITRQPQRTFKTTQRQAVGGSAARGVAINVEPMRLGGQRRSKT